MRSGWDHWAGFNRQGLDIAQLQVIADLAGEGLAVIFCSNWLYFEKFPKKSPNLMILFKTYFLGPKFMVARQSNVLIDMPH